MLAICRVIALWTDFTSSHQVQALAHVTQTCGAGPHAVIDSRSLRRGRITIAHSLTRLLNRSNPSSKRCGDGTGWA